MDGKERALDNIFTERFWRSVKYEEVYLHSYTSPRVARQSLARYLAFYNVERPHQALAYRIPAEVYFSSHNDQGQQIKATLKGGKPTLTKASFLS
jgi:putative transposase